MRNPVYWSQWRYACRTIYAILRHSQFGHQQFYRRDNEGWHTFECWKLF